MTLQDLQHFKYAGGGYFRDARVPKGKKAPVLHGSEIIEVIQNHLNSTVTKPVEPWEPLSACRQ